MSYLRYLCVFAYSGVHHTFYYVYVLFFVVLLTLHLCMLPVSLNCPFLIFDMFVYFNQHFSISEFKWDFRSRESCNYIYQSIL